MGDTAQSRSSPTGDGYDTHCLQRHIQYTCWDFACNIYRIRVTRLVGGRQLLLQEVSWLLCYIRQRRAVPRGGSLVVSKVACVNGG
jgi:hypothetical protein